MDPLTEIGLKTGTDKATWHGYTKYYHEILDEFRNRKLFFLELGFGGYEWSDAGGESVQMWSEYSPEWDIAAVDIHEKDLSNLPGNVSFYRGGQDSPELMATIVKNHGHPTIVVDDASHVSSLTNKSFKIIWPLVRPGGWYIVEDIGTSYQPSNGGRADGGPGSSVYELGKGLIDNIMANSRFGKDQNILPDVEDIGIDVIHVMPNSIAIRKKHEI